MGATDLGTMASSVVPTVESGPSVVDLPASDQRVLYFLLVMFPLVSSCELRASRARLRPPGQNPAIFSSGLDIKRAWVGDFFQSSPRRSRI
jgi:hypothetical protein